MSQPFLFMITGKIAGVIQHCTSILFWSREKDFAEASDHQEKRQECISIEPWWNSPLCIRCCSSPFSAQKYREIKVSTAQAEEMKVIFRTVVSIEEKLNEKMHYFEWGWSDNRITIFPFLKIPWVKTKYLWGYTRKTWQILVRVNFCWI